MYDHLESVHTKLLEEKVEDEVLLSAALLHHLPEVEKNYEKVIKDACGDDVYDVVQNYNLIASKNLTSAVQNEYNEDLLIKTYVNLAKDIRVLILRLADKAHNIETAFALPAEKKRKVAENALFLYAPLGRLFGARGFTKTLENEAFKILNPAQYVRIEEAIKEKNEEIADFFEEFHAITASIFEEQGIVAKVQTRIKSIYSTYRKIQKYISRGVIKDINQIDDIYDLAAARVITNTIDEVYKVEDIFKNLWDEVPNSRDDYISTPKASGYQSLHNTFKISKKLNFEVQIRTDEMHHNSEYGLASHVFYKIGDKFKKELIQNPNWLRELNYYEVYTSTKEAITQRLSHFSKFVYAFTPKGDIIELPRGAGPLDFAYHVHTDIGRMFAGAKINGSLVKIDTPINDGDVVEIMVDKSRKKPSLDWVKIVKSSKVRWAILKGLRH